MRTTPRWLLPCWTGIVVVVVVAFVFKMTEFALTLTDQPSTGFGGFGAIALATYLLGVIPLVLLTLWGICAGHFRNVERPKYRMLELQDEIAAAGNRVPLEDEES